MPKRQPRPAPAEAPPPAPPPGALDTPPGKGPIRIFKAGKNAGGDTRSAAAATRS